jgi:hypothetical protein
MQLIAIILMPSHTEETLAFLHMESLHLVESFKCIFPHVNVKPKMHYFLHYAQQIKWFGPISHFWTMRYEAKHAYFKSLFQKTKNQKNVPFSMATRHQYLKTYISNSKTSFIGPRISFHCMKNKQKLPADLRGFLDAHFPSISQVGKSLKVNMWGIDESVAFISEGNVSSDVVFNAFLCAFNHNDRLIFVCRKMWATCYVFHYNSYEVSYSNEFTVLNSNDALLYHPLGIYRHNNGIYITLIHELKLW